MPGWWCWQKPFFLRSSTMPGQWQVTVDSGVPSWDRSLLKEDLEVGQNKILNENVFVLLLRLASGSNYWKNAFLSCSRLMFCCVQGWVFCSALLWLLCSTLNLKPIMISCHIWPSQVSERGQNAETVRPFSLASTARNIEWEEEIYEAAKPEVGDQDFIFFINFPNLMILYLLGKGSRVAAGCWEIFAKKQVHAKWDWWWWGTWEDQGSPPAKGR